MAYSGVCWTARRHALDSLQEQRLGGEVISVHIVQALQQGPVKNRMTISTAVATGSSRHWT